MNIPSLPALRKIWPGIQSPAFMARGSPYYYHCKLMSNIASMKYVTFSNFSLSFLSTLPSLKNNACKAAGKGIYQYLPAQGLEIKKHQCKVSKESQNNILILNRFYLRIKKGQVYITFW